MYEPPLDDARLIYLAIPDSGWTGDTKPYVSEIKALIPLVRCRLMEGAEVQFALALRWILAKAVLADAFWRRLRLEAGEPCLSATHRSPLRKKLKPKLATIVREELRELRRLYASVQKAPGPETRSRFVQELMRTNDATREAIALIALQRSGQEPCLENGAVGTSQAEVDALGAATEGAFEIVSAFIKRGPAEPALEQMTRSLAALWHLATGKLPKRSYRDVPPKGQDRPVWDCGPFIDLCRHMARLVNQALPEQLRRPEPADMAKTAVRMMKELEREAKQVG